jgi:hypothetical protein
MPHVAGSISNPHNTRQKCRVTQALSTSRWQERMEGMAKYRLGSRDRDAPEREPPSAGLLVEVVAVGVLDVVSVVVLRLGVFLLLDVAGGLANDHHVAVGLADLVQLVSEKEGVS